MDSLVSRIIKLGKPVAVGCDVKKAPHFVEKFAVKTRAKLIVPDKNLLQRDKEIMTADWREIIKNNHQRSALASALHAYAVLEPLLIKIRKKLHGDLALFDEVAAKVLTRNVSISKAIEMVI